MLCPNCKKEISDESKFCNYCGEKLPLFEPTKPHIQQPLEYPLKANPDSVGLPEKKKIPIFKIIAILLLLGLSYYIYSFISYSNELHLQFEADKENAYPIAVEYAKNGEWKQCIKAIALYRENSSHTALDGTTNDKYTIIYDYASAQKNYAENNYSQAEFSMKDIPENYQGDLANEIKQFRATLVAKGLNPYPYTQDEINKQKEWHEKMRREATLELDVGDPESKIKERYGKPDEVNQTIVKTLFGKEVQKQYVYSSKNVYVYTTDGKVTAIQK